MIEDDGWVTAYCSPPLTHRQLCRWLFETEHWSIERLVEFMARREGC